MPLFPIHDLAREDDIRMRRRRAVFLLAGIGVGAWILLGGPAQHQKRPGFRIDFMPGAFHMPVFDPSHVAQAPDLPQADAPARSFEASTLFVDLSCASSVTLQPQANLGDRVIVSVRRGQEAALQAVSLNAGTVADAGCPEEQGDFILRFAPAKPLRIQQTDDVDIRGGRFTGPVTVEGTGSGSVVLDTTGPLTVRLRASSDMSVGEVAGPVDAELHGAGDLRIGRGTIPALSAVLTGNGDLSLGQAAIGSGRLVLSGSGDLAADRITGRLDARTSGSGDIAIGWIDADAVQIAGEGSGDIVVRGGRIGTLIADRAGSGDLNVAATIGGGSVAHHGSGDITLPHVTGTLSRTGSQDD